MRISTLYTKTGSHRRAGIRHVLLAFLVLLSPVGPLADFVTYRALAQPSLKSCESFDVRLAVAQGTSLRVMFLGVSTILLDDGETAIMTDGFFSRPGKTSLLRKIRPNQTRIAYALSKAGVTKLTAVLTAHSHYDHAMDSPEVARRTGALVIGSESTANIARGVNFPEERIRVIRGGETLTFGRFKITVIKSPHSWPVPFKGKINAPLPQAAWVWEYKEGGSYSYLIEHDGRRILIHPGANYSRSHNLLGVRADVIFLSIGKLGNRIKRFGKERDKFVKDYWREVVGATCAKVVVPIHWDNFTKPLDEPLQRTPRPFDKIDAALEIIGQLAEKDDVTVCQMLSFKSVDISKLIREQYRRGAPEWDKPCLTTASNTEAP